MLNARCDTKTHALASLVARARLMPPKSSCCLRLKQVEDEARETGGSDLISHGAGLGCVQRRGARNNGGAAQMFWSFPARRHCGLCFLSSRQRPRGRPCKCGWRCLEELGSAARMLEQECARCGRWKGFAAQSRGTRRRVGTGVVVDPPEGRGDPMGVVRWSGNAARAWSALPWARRSTAGHVGC